MKSYEIFANHAHVFQEQVRPDGTIGELLRIMDLCGISKAVAFAPFSKYFDDSEYSDQNRWLAAQIRNQDRLYGFGIVNIEKGNLKEQVHAIRGLGLRGIKIHPAVQKLKIDSPEAFEIYEAAQDEGLALSFHTGIHWHRIRDYNVLLFDEVAWHFPALRFSMEHVGGYSFFREAVAVMSNNRKNVFAGLTSVSDRGKNKYWYLDDQQLKDLFWLTGCGRSIFGLDFPYNREDQTMQDSGRLRSLGLSEEDEARIFGGNLLKFLGEQTDSTAAKG